MTPWQQLLLLPKTAKQYKCAKTEDQVEREQTKEFISDLGNCNTQWITNTYYFLSASICCLIVWWALKSAILLIRAFFTASSLSLRANFSLSRLWSSLRVYLCEGVRMYLCGCEGVSVWVWGCICVGVRVYLCEGVYVRVYLCDGVSVWWCICEGVWVWGCIFAQGVSVWG